MEIIAETIPDEEVSPHPKLERGTTGRGDALEEAQMNAAMHATALEQPTLTREMTMTQDDLLNPTEPPALKKGDDRLEV